MKSLKNTALRNFRKHKNDDSLTDYIISKQAYKSKCKRKKHEHRIQCIKHIDSKMYDAKQFWQLVKSVSDKPYNSVDISVDRWFSHFMDVFMPPES